MVQHLCGREVTRVCVYDNGNIVGYFHIIAYRLFGALSYAYIPYGPVLIEQNEVLCKYVKKIITTLSAHKKYIFTRLDFEPYDAVAETLFFRAPSASYKGSTFQPRKEWVVNVKKTDEEILDGMHEKTRYCIRTSHKKDLQTYIITENFDAHFDTFYKLMQQNAVRNHFSLHPEKYYRAYFAELAHNRDSFLVYCSYKEEVLAVYVYVSYGDTVHYVFGASSDNEKNRMPTYVAHWVGMRHVRELGYTYYNFGGIQSTSDNGVGMQSLTKYKQKFGGEVWMHGPFYDVVIRPFWYALYMLRKLFT